MWGFFHLPSPKTPLLIRNLPLDPCKLGILPNTWGHYFQFPIKSRGDLHSPLSSNRRKTDFVNERMEVWRTLSIYSLLIYISISISIYICMYIYIYIYIYIFCFQSTASTLFLTLESTSALQNLYFLKCLLKPYFSWLTLTCSCIL